MVKKGMASAVALAVMTGLFGCSEGDESVITIDAPTNIENNEGGGGDPGDGGISQNCPDWAGAKQQRDGVDVCALPAVIDQDRTLTSNIIWLMEGRVTVGNGNGEIGADGNLTNGNAVQNVILTIEAGTQVQGVTGTFANLIITRGSQLRANGTEDAPIVMSSDDEGLEGSNEWGGLIMHGFGEHNQCGVDTCNIDSEGESGFAGGFVPDDSSGSISYFVLAEGGFEFAPGNEINGISLIGVGSGTTMDHIQVEGNSDDGIEFYGGAVNVKYGVFTNNLDDSVDWDEGFVGNLQYILVRQSPNTTGNAFEMDTQGNPEPLSKPTLSNVTVVGDGVDGDEEELLVFKAGSGGFFHNMVLDVASSNTTIMNCVLIQGDDSQALINTALVLNNVTADCASDGNGMLGDDTLSTTTITMEDAALDDILASQAPSATLSEAISWDNVNGTYPESLADGSFLDETDFAGAVNPDGSDPWWANWTIDGSVAAP